LVFFLQLMKRHRNFSIAIITTDGTIMTCHIRILSIEKPEPVLQGIHNIPRKRLKRRFTNICTKENGNWKLTASQPLSFRQTKNRILNPSGPFVRISHKHLEIFFLPWPDNNVLILQQSQSFS